MSVREASIVWRLSVGFALVLALAVVVGVLALARIQKLSDVTTQLYDHPFIVSREILQMRVTFAAVDRDLEDLAQGRDPARQQERMQRMAGREAEMITRLARVRERYLGPSRDLDQIDLALTQWRAFRDEIFEQVRNHRFDQSTFRFEADGRELGRQVASSIDAVTGFALRRAEAFEAEARRRQQTAQTEVALALLLLLLAGAGTARAIVRGIVQPLGALRAAMLELARGRLDTPLPAGRVAREIQAMTEGLAVFKATACRLADQGWIKSEVGRLGMALQRADTTPAFAVALINTLAPVVQAALGMVHLRDVETGQLRPLAGYGCDMTASVGASRGLVLQCAELQQPLQLDDLPAGYVPVASGLGAALPRVLLLVPVVSHGETRAVIELAGFTPFSDLHRALIDAVLPVVVLTLEVLERGLLSRRLLEEARQQAEELRVSQEELQSQSEELRSANLQLSDQRRELEQARRHADQRADDFATASRFKSKFLANMSHELRTPLTSLLILSHGLAENVEGTLTTDQIESARVIHDSGTHLLRLINDILDLSKVEAGKLELVETTVRPAAIVAVIRRTFAPIAGQKGLYFTITCDPEVPEVFGGDAGRIEQVITNLVANACKFTSLGGVTVRLTAEPPSGAAGEGALGRLRVEVADTGIGISADKLEQIFEPFEQADGSISHHYGGTGLGLSIARHLSDLMGGIIKASSEVGQGSTFTLALPLRPPPASEVREDEPVLPLRPSALPPEEAASGTTVLIVEDDDDFARILCDLAQQRGLHPVRCGDGVEGLGLARHLRPAGILLDIGLPGLDGWAVMEALRHDPQTRAIPVHFLSASPEARRGLDAGAVGFLTKPVDRTQIDQMFARLGLGDGGRRRVLVVDDDATFRVTIRPLIESDRVEVCEAATAGAALDLLQRERFDCLILDLILPDFSGFELLDRARAAGVALPPVVVHSCMELTFDETLRLRDYTDSIIVKGSRSPERLVDEVALFLHSVQAMPPAEPAPVREAVFVDRRVLVVDDDMRNAFALSKLLRGRGFTVEIAEDGAKALARIDQPPAFDLVLMDIMMPGMDGYAVIAEIRRRPGLVAGLPILALTAKAMPGDREQCLAAGANDHLAKPVDIDRLFEMIRHWLRPRGEVRDG